jgi:hypothetical protein
VTFAHGGRPILGVVTALGLIGVWCLPRVERTTIALRVTSVAIFVAGCARLPSLARIAAPE